MKYTREILEPIVAESLCYSDVLRKLKATHGFGGLTHTIRRIKQLELNTKHFKTASELAKLRPQNVDNNKKDPKDIFKFLPDGSHRTKTHQLVRALIEIGRSYICQECGLKPEWNGKQLTLQVDHIDGNPLNNTRENLQFICPNCHSQTLYFNRSNKEQIKKMATLGCVDKVLKLKKKTCKICFIPISSRAMHCRKCAARIRFTQSPRISRITKISWPDRDTLRKMVDDTSYLATARELGVSDNAVRKRLKMH